jgi:hypothetical protein
MEICKNCKGVIEDGKHQSSVTECKNLVELKSLVGIRFMDGYFEFEVVKRDGNDYRCDGRRANRLKNQLYTHEFIVRNYIQ